MKKIIKRIFQIAGIALAAYILCQIFYYRIYLNIPSAAAKGLQKKITEEMGEGFKLTNPTHENTEISYIDVDIDSELYMDETALTGKLTIFPKCPPISENQNKPTFFRPLSTITG